MKPQISFKDFEAGMRMGSATVIAQGKLPLVRTHAGLVSAPIEQMVSVGIAGGIEAIGPQGRSPFTSEDARIFVDNALHGAPTLVDTAATARRVANLVGGKPGKTFALLATVPFSGVCVATRALELRFWHPQGGDIAKLSAWMNPLGLNASNPWQVGELLLGSPNLAQMSLTKAITRLVERIVGTMTYGERDNISSSAMNSVYSLVSTITAAAGGYSGVDKTRVGELTQSGESSILTFTKKSPGRVKG